MDHGNERIRLTSLDSFEDDPSDIDDEVFIKSSNKTLKIRPRDDSVLKKPLMAPRKKVKAKNGFIQAEVHTSVPGCPLLTSVLYLGVALGALIGLIGLVVFLVKYYIPSWLLQYQKYSFQTSESSLAPCDTFEIEQLWSSSFPNLVAGGTSALQAVDVNQDGVHDLILGFQAGFSSSVTAASFVCQSYFNVSNCRGGLAALNGSSGTTLWQQWVADTPDAMQCRTDFNKDDIPDCVFTGSTQGIYATDSKEGILLWSSSNGDTFPACLKLAQYSGILVTRDLDNDSVQDVLTSSVGAGSDCVPHFLFISGRSGDLLQLIAIPHEGNISVGPYSFDLPDGLEGIILGVQYQQQSKPQGVLYWMDLQALHKGSVEARVLYNASTTFTSVVLADLSGDDVEEIVASTADGQLMTFNGVNLKPLWNYKAIPSTSARIKTLGCINGDKIPDILFESNTPNGTVDITRSVVIDGSSGHILLTLPVRPGFVDVPGLTLTLEGRGNDVMLRWVEESLESSVNLPERPTYAVHQFLGLTGRGELPGLVIYSSDTQVAEEANVTIPSPEPVWRTLTTSAEAQGTFAQIMLDSLSASPHSRLAAASSYRTNISRKVHKQGKPASKSLTNVPSHDDPKHGHERGRYNSVRYSNRHRPSAGPPRPPPTREPLPLLRQRNEYPDDSISNYDYVEEPLEIENSPAAKAAWAANGPRYPQQEYLYDTDAVKDWAPEPDPDNETPYEVIASPRRWANGRRRGKRVSRNARLTRPGLLQHRVATKAIWMPALDGQHNDRPGTLDVIVATQWTWPVSAHNLTQTLEDCLAQLNVLAGEGTESRRSALINSFLECLNYPNASRSQATSESRKKQDSSVWLRPLVLTQGWLKIDRYRLRCRCHAEPLHSGRACARVGAGLQQRWPSSGASEGYYAPWR